MSTAPPLTFHGERFGRSVAGARALLRPPRSRRSGAGLAGVLLDVATVETIVTPEPPIAPERTSHPSTGHPRAVHTRAPVAAHRKPVVPAAASELLMGADATFPWSAPSPRPSPGLTAGLSWTVESGFRTAHPGSPAAGPAPAAVTGSPPEPQLRYLPTPGRRTVDERPTAPHDVVGAVAGATGVHVGDAVIDRSPRATEQAADLGAIAFTRHGVVHLPAELGPLDEPAARAVLAHELTHVAQHRRRGGDVPAEHTAEGRALEAEARAVQASLQPGAPVTPAFRRRHPGRVRGEGPLGVQRLADDDDPYAWQNRPMTGGEQALALFGDHGYGLAAGSAAADRRDRRDRAADERFEQTHARDLQHRRDRRWAEIHAEAEREARAAAAREDREFEQLGRAELLALREQLDAEMPFEYGIPHGIDPYPGPELPAPTDEERRAEERRRTRSTARSGTGRAPGHGPVRRVAGHHLPVVGRFGGGVPHRVRGTGAGEGDTTRFGWQGRELTGRETNEALFGDGLFGALIGLGISDADERADRQRMEQEELPELLGRRREHELELRHRRLRERHTEQVRTPEAPAAPGEPARPSPWPARLSDAEIAEIRAQVDEEMPLEFHTMRSEDYLDRNSHVEITREGAFAHRTGESPVVTPPAPGRPPAPAPSPTPTSTATPTAPTAVAPPTAVTPPTATTTGPAPATVAGPGPAAPTQTAPAPTDTAPAPTDTAPAPTEPTTAPVPAPTGLAAPAPTPGGGLLGAAAGVAVGAGVARLADDADAHNADELIARRVFAAATDLDLDSLTRRLYGRIRRELRSELLVDRERNGSLADAR